MCMRTIGIEEARKTLGDIANEIHYGRDEDPVILTRVGKPVVQLTNALHDGDHRIYLNVPTDRLAKMILDGGGDEDRARSELFYRRPHLAGFHAAAECLQRRHHEAWWEARGGFDPWSTDAPDDEAPGYAILMAEYLTAVKRMAES